MTLIDLNIKNFTQEVAAATPAPGGGSIAALCGSLSAALCHMVAELTLGKKNYKAAEPFMINVKKKSILLQKELLKQVDEDTFAYGRVVDAFRQPKETASQIKVRHQIIQDALKAAAWVPYQTLKTAALIMELIEDVIEKGNPNCITDAGVAAELTAAAVQGAAYNVYINLMDINDDAFSLKIKKAIIPIQNDIRKKIIHIRKTIEHSINMEL